ncbi:unnamed protein product [Owenia fusiformis]|uniref:Peptidase S1 domain-containing protein n=1 Tax=Owenia fusiformis TaxID=6347 RepID=A0A8S4NTM5_OWEFU|nr:unnamed protein product [Owenia fusiformis]
MTRNAVIVNKVRLNQVYSVHSRKVSLCTTSLLDITIFDYVKLDPAKGSRYFCIHLVKDPNQESRYMAKMALNPVDFFYLRSPGNTGKLGTISIKSAQHNDMFLRWSNSSVDDRTYFEAYNKNLSTEKEYLQQTTFEIVETDEPNSHSFKEVVGDRILIFKTTAPFTVMMKTMKPSNSKTILEFKSHIFLAVPSVPPVTSFSKVSCPLDKPMLVVNGTQITCTSSKHCSNGYKCMRKIGRCCQRELHCLKPLRVADPSSSTLVNCSEGCPSDNVCLTEMVNGTNKSEICCPSKYVCNTAMKSGSIVMRAEDGCNRCMCGPYGSANCTNKRRCRNKKLNEDQCGRSAPFCPPRPLMCIVGGEQVDYGTVPWMVSLHRSGKHVCGASLINKRWVITAAHCFKEGTSLAEWEARLGDHLQSRIDIGEQHIPLSKIFIHPKYTSRDEETERRDIALVKLAHAVNYTHFVQPICLPEENPLDNPLEFANMKCYTAGWGKRKGGDWLDVVLDTLSDSLQRVDLPLIPHRTCKKKTWYGDKVKWFMQCAGKEYGGQDSCSGDSGGPLMCDIPDKGDPRVKLATLVGVTSWGQGCGQPRKPGVYTKIYEFMPWIKRKVERH